MRRQLSEDLLVGFPGADLLLEGLRDLQVGRLTVSACLVLVGAPKLTRMGIDVPKNFPLSLSPEHQLFELLSQSGDPRTTHSRYNALIRRLVSCERALSLLDC